MLFEPKIILNLFITEVPNRNVSLTSTNLTLAKQPHENDEGLANKTKDVTSCSTHKIDQQETDG